MGLEWNGTDTKERGMANGKIGEWLPWGLHDGAFFGCFLFLSGCARPLAFAIAFRFRLPVVDRGIAMACFSLGKGGSWHSMLRILYYRKT